MPPQQSDRPLDVFDDRLNFRAHEIDPPGSRCPLTNRRAFSESWWWTQPTLRPGRARPDQIEADAALKSSIGLFRAANRGQVADARG
jgi:hypothetical protein